VETIADWWLRCVQAGATPCGLGARDSLRLEKCYPLNGSDLSPDRTPLEAGLGFFVNLEKGDFVGREVLIRQKAGCLTQRLVALRAVEKKAPPPRHGYALYQGDQAVGTLTSGGISPGSGCGIAMAYVDASAARVGTKLEMDVRGKRFGMEVVRKPFV
jgi:aminomethyltransferase